MEGRGRPERSIPIWAYLVALFILLPEFGLYAAANHGPIPGAAGHCTVLALGYSGDDTGVAGMILRYRMGVAIDALRRYSCDRLIVSGGKPHSKATEASTMARYAAEHGVTPGKIMQEDRSTTTSENVRFSLPKIAPEDHILIASDPAHALRAKRDLCRQAPSACARAHVAAPFRPFDAFLYQWVSVWWNGRAILRDWLLG